MDTAHVLQREGNFAVVQLAKRRFPALATQGDTFFVFVDNLRHALMAEDSGRCRDELKHALAEMENALTFYKRTLIERGMELPWREVDSSE